MVTIEGLHNTALCYTAQMEEGAAEQIKTVCDQEAFAACKIRIMPDVHEGKGCTIGTTMTITDKIVPGMVGVDIGCGMETVRLDVNVLGSRGSHSSHSSHGSRDSRDSRDSHGSRDSLGSFGSLDFARLDEVIHNYVPSGFNIRKVPHRYADEIDLSELRCAHHVNLDRAYKSVGTLGGGNHFIEVDGSEQGEIYIVVHSGSRHLGCEVADYYQREGFNALCGCSQRQIEDVIAQLKAEGRQKEIQSTIKHLKKQTVIPVPKELAYVEGSLFDDYLHDMKIIQRFAVLNRKAMIDTILVGMRLSPVEAFTTIHNYIDTDSMMLRKGAVSAKAGEKLLIPINMRDGSLICVGKGNPDWNCSAPHGAGRIMSRGKALHELTMAQYEAEMRGIYSTCVLPETLDESPMAYKPIDVIVAQIAPTAEIVARIKPLYNFKAAETDKRRRR